jgi:menaquinone-specific isochorismate synthase
MSPPRWLVAALHPSAAVGGTPTDLAVALIAELEHMDRGRYAGPVGWIDASGDGEWGIALRCGWYVAGRPDLAAALRRVRHRRRLGSRGRGRESDAKLVPMRDALSGV